MNTRLNQLLLAAAAALTFPVAAHAAIVFSDNFETDTAGSPPPGWTTNSPANVTLTTVSDTNTGGTGSTQSLDVNQSNSPGAGTPEPAMAGFSPVTLANTDSLVLSFNVAALTAPAAQDRVFRFGLYNAMNPSTAPTLSTTGTPEGYAGRLDEGTPAPTTGDAWASVGFLGSSTTSTPPGKSLGTTTNVAADVSNIVDLVTMTLTRAGNNITDSITVTSSAGTVTYSGTDSTTTVGADTGFTFNELMIGQSGGAALDYRLDNVTVTYNQAATPEPASLAVLTLGASAMLTRRRRTI